MRLAVTGAAGLLGRHVAAACHAAGHDVLGIDRMVSETAPWQQITVDLCDLGAAMQALYGCEAVLHCAAIPRPVGHAPSDVWRVNMSAAYAAVEGAVAGGARLFVQASSFSVLGPPFGNRLFAPQALPVSEQHPPAPQDVYAVTKWLAEELVEAAVRRGAFRAVSLRMPWIHTPESFARDVVPRRRTPDAARDLWSYLDARDAGAAFVAALTWSGNEHLRCYLSAQDTYSQTPTAELIAREWGTAVPLTRPLVGHASLIDSSLATEALGFTPRHTWRDYAMEEA